MKSHRRDGWRARWSRKQIEGGLREKERENARKEEGRIGREAEREMDGGNKVRQRGTATGTHCGI